MTTPNDIIRCTALRLDLEAVGAGGVQSLGASKDRPGLTDFEAQVKAAAEKAVLQFISTGGWLLPNHEARLKVPVEWVAECWRLVDADKVRAHIAARIEGELAERMMNQMATELATDIKQILSVKERREMLRGLARDHMEAVMGASALIDGLDAGD